MIIGVAGKCCAGKDQVCRILETRGYTSIDLDQLGHQALENHKTELAGLFGSEILDAEGTLDRKALGEKVFRSPESLNKLERIIHPAVDSLAELQISRTKGDLLIHAALLYKSQLQPDVLIWVQSSLIRRIFRAFRRDRRSLGLILRRIGAQRELRSQHFSRYDDIYIVSNNRSLKALEAQVLKIEDQYRSERGIYGSGNIKR